MWPKGGNVGLAYFPLLNFLDAFKVGASMVSFHQKLEKYDTIRRTWNNKAKFGKLDNLKRLHNFIESDVFLRKDTKSKAFKLCGFTSELMPGHLR